MKQNNHTGTSASIWKGTSIGVVAALITGIILSPVGAYLIMQETIPENMYGILSAGILFAATFVGALLASKKVMGQYAVVCGVVAGVNIVLCVASNILFCGSQYGNAGIGLVAIIAAGIIACILSLKPEKRKNKNFKRRSG